MKRGQMTISDKLARQEQKQHDNWVKQTFANTQKQNWSARDFFTSVNSHNDTPTKELTSTRNGYDISVIVYLDEGTEPNDFQCFVTVDSPKSNGPELMKASEVDAYINKTT